MLSVPSSCFTSVRSGDFMCTYLQQVSCIPETSICTAAPLCLSCLLQSLWAKRLPVSLPACLTATQLPVCKAAS